MPKGCAKEDRIVSLKKVKIDTKSLSASIESSEKLLLSSEHILESALECLVEKQYLGCPKAEEVINVVGMEQTLAQNQLKLALCALGYLDQAKKLIHFAYNLVTLPGYKMSSRRGRYITLDEVMDESVSRAYEEVKKRSLGLSTEEKQEFQDSWDRSC